MKIGRSESKRPTAVLNVKLGTDSSRLHHLVPGIYSADQGVRLLLSEHDLKDA